MPTKRLDLTGKKYGSLLVEGLDHVHKKAGTMWYCTCDCGRSHVVRGSHLTSGNIHRCSTCKSRSTRNPSGIGEMSIHYWNQILRGADRRDIPVEITHQDAYDLFIRQDRKCTLTGMSIQFPETVNDRDNFTASLDRIKSDEGYTQDNIQWVHKIINRMKMDTNQQDFINWCKSVATFSDM